MNVLRITVFSLLLMVCQISFSKSDSDANINADNFISGLLIADIPEGRKKMHDAAWKEITSIPVVQDQKILFEGMFDTDILGVQGFKRLLELKVLSKANTTLTKRYLLISFKDKKTGVWRVFDIRDSTSPEREIEMAKQQLNNTQFVKAQFNYRRYAYWLTFGGKLQEAKQAHQTAMEINKSQPEIRFSMAEYERSMEILMSIIGE